MSIVPRPEASPSSKSESESASPFVFKSNGSIAKSDKKCRKVRTADFVKPGRVLLETESRVSMGSRLASETETWLDGE